MILGITNQKLWVFEILRRSLGRSGMCWNKRERVDQKCQGGDLGFEKKGHSIQKKGFDQGSLTRS
jgi:hypothetical protein